MKLFIILVLLIFFQTITASSQRDSSAIAVKSITKYVQLAGSTRRDEPKAFSLITSFRLENHPSSSVSINGYYNYRLQQRIKSPFWQDVLTVAGQLALSAFTEKQRLYFNSPAPIGRYPGLNNHW